MDSQDTRNDATQPRDGDATPADGLARSGDARFTTWRPGVGPPPVVPASPAARAGAPLAVAEAPPPAAVAPRPEPVRPAPAPPRDDAPPAPAAAPGAPAPLDDFFYRPDELAPALATAGVQAGPDPAQEAEPETTSREEYLTFLLGAEEYAVAIERVREVLRCPPITEVPRAPAHVLGVVTVRGEVVAVVDPRRRLGAQEPPPRDGAGRLVIVDAGDGPCALLVDGVTTVVRLRPGSIEARPQGLGTAAAECLAGIGRDRERLFTVLDLAAMLRRPPPARREGRANAGA